MVDDRPSPQRPSAPDPAFEDVGAMLRATDLTSVSAIRNTALVAVLALGGLRVSAALALREGDFSAGFGRVRVAERDRVRVVELLEGAAEPLARWADERRSLGVSAGAPFFCTMRGGPLAPSYVRDAVARLAERAGVDAGVSAEALRRTHVRELRRRGWSLRRIQTHLGHRTQANTRRFLARADAAVRAGAGRAPGRASSPGAPVLGPLLPAIVGAGAGSAVAMRAVRGEGGLLLDLEVTDVALGEGGPAGWAGLAAPGARLSEADLPAIERAELLDVCRAALESGRLRAHEATLTAGDGVRRMSLNVAPVGGDVVVAVAGAPRDDADAPWAGPWGPLWEQASTALIGLDEGGTVVRANAAARRLVGDEGPADAGPPSALRRLRVAHVRDAAAVGRTTVRLPTGAGEVHAEARVDELWPPLGPCRYVLSIVPEAVATAADRGLTTTLTAYRTLVDHAPDHIARFGSDGRLLHANPAFHGDLATGGPQAAAGWWERERSGRLERLAQAVATAVRTGARSECTVEVRVAGSRRTFEWVLGPERGPDGAVTHVVGLGRDITRRAGEAVRTRRALRLKAALLRVTQMAVVSPRGAFNAFCEETGRFLGADTVVLLDDADGGEPVVKGRWPADRGEPGAAGLVTTIPLGASGPRWGVLRIGWASRTPPAVDDVVVGVLSRAASEVARLERVRGRAAVEAALTRMALLDAGRTPPETALTALAREAADLLGAQHGMLLEAEDGRARVTARWVQPPVPQPAEVGDTVNVTGKCAAARTLRSGRPTVIADVTGIDDVHTRRLARSGLRSALAAPLADRGEPWGLLCVASTEVGAFDSESRGTFASFASLAGRLASEWRTRTG